jgi:hypothetical protein
MQKREEVTEILNCNFTFGFKNSTEDESKKRFLKFGTLREKQIEGGTW